MAIHPSSPGGSFPQLSPLSSAAGRGAPAAATNRRRGRLRHRRRATTLGGRAPTSGSSGSPAAASRSNGCAPTPASTQEPPSQDTPARGRCPASVWPRVPNASTSSPSSPARSVWSSRTRWTMQSPGPTSNAAPSSRQTPEPPSTKKISSSAVCTVKGRRPLAGIDPDPLEADRLRPGGLAEIRPLTADVAGFAPAALGLVPMGDHMPIMSRASAVRRRSTTSSVPFGVGRFSRASSSASRRRPAQLRQQLAGRSAVPVELVDPVKPREDVRFVHELDASGALGNGSATPLSRKRDDFGLGGLGQPRRRAQTEEHVVERANERVAIAVPERLDERAPNGGLRPAARLARRPRERAERHESHAVPRFPRRAAPRRATPRCRRADRPARRAAARIGTARSGRARAPSGRAPRPATASASASTEPRRAARRPARHGTSRAGSPRPGGCVAAIGSTGRIPNGRQSSRSKSTGPAATGAAVASRIAETASASSAGASGGSSPGSRPRSSSSTQ